MNAFLQTALLGAATGQVCIACLNFTLIRILGWKEELTRVPLLMREVFHVHVWFISITLLIFALLTWRFSGEMAAGSQPVYRWLACAIGGFWAIRAVLQVAYYSSSHWRGNAARTVVHVVLLIVYWGFAAAYLTAGLQR